MQLKHIKPYLFILAFLLIPLLFVPAIKMVKNKFINDNQYIAIDSVIAKEWNYGIVIHGGAGNFTKESFSPEQEAQYLAKLTEAVHLGISKLNQGDSAVHVVVTIIKLLEDSPLFNAGKGAVFTHDGKNELDASIMNGIDKNAGAVAGVTTIKNPIEAAYEVMVHSKHVLLAREGAEEFAKKQKLEIVSPNYFYTEKQHNNLQKALEKERIEKFGTVGCAVLDKYGNLAAGTSTGGMTNKKYGRVGDSPIIGAGTYADNKTCAISATGHGEYFIRQNVSYDISARMKYLHEDIKTSAKNVIVELGNMGGYGGIVGIDKNGNISMEFNTRGMFRGYCQANKEPKILLYN
ncbi:MAG: isoaspartyl peptidase/L-asparaginase [Bacteroidales bacterium]|nr:isoaspartyl peptidase/L-asparaginase [Bacteroidales bacterium]